MSEKLNLANPMAYQEVGDVGTWGSGVVSEADPVEKNQEFDTRAELRKNFLKEHGVTAITIAELTRLNSEEIAA